MQTVVTGGTGQLGNAFRRLIPHAVFPSRQEFDLSRPGDLAPWLEETRPDLLINCAAYTAVDRAEEEEEVAHIVNAEAVGEMARVLARRAIPFVTFSTDYVFDGSGGEPYIESDPTGPVNAYGRTKLDGELLALQAHPGALVIRTSWVLSGTHANFVDTILRLVRERELRVVDDQRGCPTFVDDLAPAVLDALEAGATGVLHLTNSGDTTWFGLAREAVTLSGQDPDRVAPCTTAEYPLPAPRPAYSVLGSVRRGEFGVEALPRWKCSLRSIVTEIEAKRATTSR